MRSLSSKSSSERTKPQHKSFNTQQPPRSPRNNSRERPQHKSRYSSSPTPDKPRKERNPSSSSVNQTPKIKAVLRIRPLMIQESKYSTIKLLSNRSTPRASERPEQAKTIEISQDYHTYQFSFHAIANPSTSQRDMYTNLQNIVPSFLMGCSSTIFAYGQTGAGKTYTTLGHNFETGQEEQVGLLPRILRDVFRLSGEMKIRQQIATRFWLSFYEIYNEQVYDLFQPSQPSTSPMARQGVETKRPRGLSVNEEKDGSVTISNLLQFEITNEMEGIHLMERGLRNRAQRETAQNAHSSRSHAIFQLTLLRQNMRPSLSVYDSSVRDQLHPSLRIAKLRVVDLAGSQKLSDLKKSKQATEELLHINKSLSALGKCLVGLNESTPSRHISFRESKLTRLLRDSLLGQANVILIACVSPSLQCLSETLATLKFAERAQKAVLAAPRLAISQERTSRKSSMQSVGPEQNALHQLNKKYKKLQEEYQNLKKENAQLRDANLSFCIPKQFDAPAHMSASSDTWASMQELYAAMDQESEGMGGTMKLVKKDASLLIDLEQFKQKVKTKLEGETTSDLTQAFQILEAILKIAEGKQTPKPEEFKDRGRESKRSSRDGLVKEVRAEFGAQQPRQKKKRPSTAKTKSSYGGN